MKVQTEKTGVNLQTTKIHTEATEVQRAEQGFP